MDFAGGSAVESPPANAGDSDSTSGSRRSPGGGNGNTLQCSCLGNPMERGAWWSTVHGVAESDMTLRLSNTKAFMCYQNTDSVLLSILSYFLLVANFCCIQGICEKGSKKENRFLLNIMEPSNCL